MSSIAALLFDADDTLWNFQIAQRNVTSDVIAAAVLHEPRLAGLTTERVIEIRREMGRTAAGDDVVALRVATFRHALAEVGVEDEVLAGDLTAAFLEGLTCDLPLYDDTIDVLEWCAARYRLGLVTNGTKGPEAGGLERFFETSVLGTAEGVAKPDPRLFHLALERMGGLGPVEVVVIGDNEHVDIAGAAAAGMRSILVDRHRTGSSAADAVVNELAEIPAVLETVLR
jgi:putative hydrolase of the HAD superfamily